MVPGWLWNSCKEIAVDDSSSKKWLKVAGVMGAAALAGYAGTKLFSVLNRKRGGAPLLDQVAATIDRTVGWPALPWPAGLATLTGLRHILRRENLHDTSTPPAGTAPPPWDERYRTIRTVDGTYNDLDHPLMGSAGTRFGRNVPLQHTVPTAVLSPSPRRVSRELMTRHEFQPATTLNLLVAAWIQFMVRDWLSHGRSETENPWEVPVDDGDDWHEKPMRIFRTRRDPTRSPAEMGLPPTYLNTETHWWDGSQIYGSTKEFQSRVRTGQDGKLHVGPDDLVVIDNEALVQQASLAGWWVGLSLMFTLFTLEHNAICDRLRSAYPSWSDDDLFEHARLINAALLAKIHTVEWTPAIIAHPTTQAALYANWWGIAGERIHQLLGRISESEVISGIPGSKTNHFGVPYSITEEFVAVYRMHPLIPDDLTFHSAADDSVLESPTFPEVAGKRAQEVVKRVSMTDLFYSFGRMHPGAVRLNNYPRSLQRFERPDGIVIDLAAHDILRTRELGVPRYNEFRRLLHLRPAQTFEELTDVPEWAEEIRRVYHNDIEQVDLIVGMFAEPLPKGFGFSDTAFRIFILMASRRLNSDRFFTTDFTPEVYSPVGMEWIEKNTLGTVLLRHYPRLAPALRGLKNPFLPWSRVKA
jgi:Animal haem peroxidase